MLIKVLVLQRIVDDKVAKEKAMGLLKAAYAAKLQGKTSFTSCAASKLTQRLSQVTILEY
jgi:hypothetical protein